MSFNFNLQAQALDAALPAPAVGEAKAIQGINLKETFTLGSDTDKLVADIYKTPADMVNLLTGNIMILGGIFLFLMVILAGFKFLQEDTKAKEEAKKIMKSAFVGFLLIFSAYWIIQIIKVVTGADLGL